MFKTARNLSVCWDLEDLAGGPESTAMSCTQGSARELEGLAPEAKGHAPAERLLREAEESAPRARRWHPSEGEGLSSSKENNLKPLWEKPAAILPSRSPYIPSRQHSSLKWVFPPEPRWLSWAGRPCSHWWLTSSPPHTCSKEKAHSLSHFLQVVSCPEVPES